MIEVNGIGECEAATYALEQPRGAATREGLGMGSGIKCFSTAVVVGSILLLVMAAFHGSGFTFVSEAIGESNASAFLKDVVPAIFVHVSIHLVGLSAFGFLVLFLKHAARGVAALLAVVVMADAMLAFHMGGAVPAILLTSAAMCFAIAAVLRPRANT